MMRRTTTIGATRWVYSYLCAFVLGWSTMSQAQVGSAKVHQKTLDGTQGIDVDIIDATSVVLDDSAHRLLAEPDEWRRIPDHWRNRGSISPVFCFQKSFGTR